MHLIGTLPIETNRLYLRRADKGDAWFMFLNWCSKPHDTRYLTWKAHPSVDETQRILDIWLNEYEKETTFRWVIVWKENQQPIGMIDVVKLSLENETATIGYVLSDDYWCQGIMTEALIAVESYLFERVHVHRIVATHDVANVASGRVMEKAGLRYEGLLKRAFRNNEDQYIDLVTRAILKEEYLEGKR